MERIQRNRNKKTQTELVNRMKDKIKDLVEKQFEIENKIVTNDTIADDIATKLFYFASGREKEKFLLHVEEFDSVTCLILGLAGRLAKAEENILEQKTEVKEEQMVERIKRDKLGVQLEEARDLQDNIDKKGKLYG